MMQIDAEEYFFYEWLILAKQLSEEDIAKLNIDERKLLVLEYERFQKTLSPC